MGRAERGSGRLRHVTQNEKVGPGTGYDRVGPPLGVAELDERSPLVDLLDDGANLPARKSLRRKVDQQGNDVQEARVFVLHHSTQQVTNLGKSSPVRTIQIVLTTATNLAEIDDGPRHEAKSSRPGPFADTACILHVARALTRTYGDEQAR